MMCLQKYAKQRTTMKKRNSNEETEGQLKHLHHPALSMEYPTGHKCPFSSDWRPQKVKPEWMRGEPSKPMIQDKQDSKNRLLQLENNKK